jgi:Flp pilus assembly protein TadD
MTKRGDVVIRLVLLLLVPVPATAQDVAPATAHHMVPATAQDMAPATAQDIAPAVAQAPGPAPLTSFSIIDAAIAEGRLETARDIIGRLAPTQDSPELRLRAAELALANNALPEAVAAFTALVPAIGPRASQGLGLAKFRGGDPAAARQALEAAVAADPTLVRSWIALGVIADRDRDFARADLAYDRALGVAPDSSAALSNRGYSLMLRGRHADAEADLARALAIEPQLKVAQTNLRLARAMQGKYRQAFEGSTKATLASDLNTVGFGAMARGDTKTAETYFNRALALNPSFDPVAWANLRYLKAITQPLGLGPGNDLDGN